MAGFLIKDTTREEREQIVADSLGNIDAYCDGCMCGITEMYQYYPVVTEEEFSRRTLGGVISKYFENSYLGAVSALVEEEKISVDELRELIDRIETQNRR